MTFRLYYRGLLKSNGRSKDKHEIRLMIHPQLVKLWQLERNNEFADYLKMDNNPCILHEGGERDYACLITERLKIYAELDILFLRAGEPGKIIVGGDIDNRLKTLFDALRMPQNEGEFPKDELLSRTPNPCYCVLSDDALISRVSVTTDTFLDAKNDDEVILIIMVTVRKSVETWGNMSYLQ